MRPASPLLAMLATAVALVLGAAGPAPAKAAATDPCGIHPWCDRALSPEQRADLVVAAMTTQEKVDFLGGDDFQGGTSSGPDLHTGIQDGVPRLGVPTVYYTDGPLGPRQGPSTGMPAPLGLAATFDPGLARLYGETVGDESRAKGNDVVFGPTINIMRTPLGGRTYEAYGEDPFLTTQMAVSWIEGLQSQGEMADVKHFAENSQEGEDPTGRAGQPGAPIGVGLLGSRYLANAIVDDRTLHEVELRGFQAAVQQAHAATVMCSYNQVNGTYACENPTLLQRILRGEWGFDGYVLADYGAAHNTVASLRGGLDFEPWPPAAYQPAEIEAALLAGVPVSTLDQHVRHVLATWFRFGIFDNPRPRNDDRQIDWGRDAARATRIEEQAITLLTDRHRLLPLNARAARRIAVIGRAADTFVTGGGSGNVTPHRFVSLLDGIRGDARHDTVTYDDGTDVAAATADARAADVAIVAASDYYTEGADRSCLSLECPDSSGDQDALIEQVAAANPHTVVVLESGGPDLTPWRGRVGAVLEAWYPGGPGGRAVADVLFGRADPGGRLPATFPAAESQIPNFGNAAAYPGIADQVRYSEGLDVGYRWYDSRGERPAFPFGFGESYTRFRFARLRFGRPVGPAETRLPIQVTVTNTGSRRGWAVAELYLHIPGTAALPEPPDTLEGFAKLSVGPHRSRTATIMLDARSLSYWDAAAQAFRVRAGCDTIMVGPSSRSLPLRLSLEAPVRISRRRGRARVRPCDRSSPPA